MSLWNGYPRLRGTIKSVLRVFPLPVPKIVGGSWWLSHPFQFFWKAEPHVLGWTRDTLRKGDIFFDVGAHAGWISLAGARQVGAEGRVVAFEPSPALAALIRYHRRVNRAGVIALEQAAVSDLCGVADFFLSNQGYSSINSLIRAPVRCEPPAESGLERITVQTWSLDKYCEHMKLIPRVIKIDVEGAELRVLRGALKLLAKFKPTLIVAVHPPLLVGGDREDLFDLLRKNRYSIYDSHTILFENHLWGDYLFV